ncbi:MAG TPA: RsmD family RNA methyltransferase [Pirellulales bacterium]|jgi:16S rRNA (guanine(966)-N(2))-methyltransferase RsmD|nr:RsmD family RNA methyltransferase [Pirellulales bacterium]
MKHKRPNPASQSTTPARNPAVGDAEEATARPRIIGGKFRHRRLIYAPNLHTRPMKDRVREAVFNLIGPAVEGKHVIDLFAGTGALGFEGLSRGAAGATFVDRHFPTADLIRQNAAALEVAERVTVYPANVLLWSRRLPPLPAAAAWLVFCSPPWDIYVEQSEAVLGLLQTLLDHAPAASIFVVEADERFDLGLLPRPGEWMVREYPPAIVAILG